MNSNYKLVYSEILNTWVAVAEHVSARGKKSALRLVTAAALMAGGAVGTGPSLAAPPLITPPAVNQLPTGAQVAAGTVSFSKTQTATAASMAVQQSSNQAIVNWQSFNVGANAKVNITQPNSTSVLLNRVQSSDPSQIFGQINANGQVLLLNPNGVYFAPGSRVDVGSFTASTHSISDADFLNGKHQFNRNGATGSILNEGHITSGLGGYIALLAPEVRNLGVVLAQMGGTVALAAGESFELQFNSNKQLTNVLVTPATLQTLVDNGQAVQAPGGLIILSAQAASGLLGGVVKNSGSISATGLVNDGGTIRLSASHKIELAQTSSISADAAPNSVGKGGRIDIITDLGNASGITQVDGTISAKGGEQGGDGGFVDTSAATLNVADTARVSTLAPQGQAGNWLLDPYDFTISANGGNITGAALTTALANGSVTITAPNTCAGITCTVTSTGTMGDIYVIDAVSWSANTLTLNSGYNIYVGTTSATGSLTVTGTGSLALNPSTSTITGYTTGGAVLMGMASTPTGGLNTGYWNGTAFSTGAATGFNGQINVNLASGGTIKINNNTYTVINSETDFRNMTLNSTAVRYILGSNLAFTTSYSQAVVAPGISTPFKGNFNGFGHEISGLSINNSTASSNTGLFGYASAESTNISNIGVAGSITTTSTNTNSHTGGLIGQLGGDSYGSVFNAYSTTVITAVNTTNERYVGGLIGYAEYVTIKNVSAAGAVTASGGVGGLIGRAGERATVSYANASGAVTATSVANGNNSVGGLIGYIRNSDISYSYATGAVNANNTLTNSIGGLVGKLDGGSITYSYAAGNVTNAGGGDTGGLVGHSAHVSLYSNVYATGNVQASTATGFVGGLIANMYNNGGGTVSYAYASNTVTGPAFSSQNSTGGLIGQIGNGLNTNTYANGTTLTYLYWDSSKNPTITGVGSLLRNNTNTAYGSGSTASNVSSITTANLKAATNIAGFTFGSAGFGYAGSVNGGLPVLCTVSLCTSFESSVVAATYNGASGGLWSLSTNWLGGIAPVAGSTVSEAIINSGSTVNFDTANVGSLGFDIRNAGTISFTGSSDVTLSGVISGAGSLTMAGNGTVTLSGANTYTGGTTISAGTLQLGAGGATGSIEGNVTNNATLAFNRSDNLTYANVISGTGSVTKMAANTLTFTGTNTYSGGTSISTGTLKTGSATALGTGAISVSNGAALDLNGMTMTSTGVLTLNGTGISSGGALTNSSSTAGTYAGNITLGMASSVGSSSGDITASGAISGAHALTKIGTDTLTLSGTNTYSGGTTINLGTLKLGAGGATGSIEGNVTNNATLAFNRSDNLTYTNVISGTGSVTKLAANTLTFTGDNTYSGGTTISAGTLKTGSATALGTGVISVSNGAALDLNGQTMTSTGVLTLRGTGVSGTGALLNSGSTAATYAGALALGANSSIMSGSTTTSINLTSTDTLAGGGFTLTLDGPEVSSANHLYSSIDNTTAKIIKNSSVFWTFYGNNTYSGGTDINGGTIRAGSPTALGSGAITVASGGSLDLRGQTMTSTGTLSLNGTGYANLGALRNSNATAAAYAGPVVLTGNANVIAQTGAIQLTHTGTITGATFGLTLGGDQGGSIAAIIGTTTGSLTKQDGGTWILGGANTYSGGTTISAGTLKLGSATAAGSGAIGVGIGGALDLNGQTLTSTGALTLNSTGVANGGALVNSSSSAGTYAGAVTLASDSSYGGVGAITFGSTVNSASSAAYALSSTSAGNLVFNAAVGASYALSSLSTGTGTTTLGANVTTVGAQTYGGPVVIKNSSGVTLANTNSAITFGATVDSLSATSYGLTLSNGGGATTFTGAIGATEAIGALTVNGTGTITLGGNVSTKGNQSYFGPVSIAAGVTMTANPLAGTSGIITNGNNNDSYYAFGVTGLTSSSIIESNHYIVSGGSSSAAITSATNSKLGIMFYNNTGTMNGAGTNNNWCCINYPVLVDAGQSTLLNSLTVVTRGDGMSNRVPTAVSVYGSNTPFTSANKFHPSGTNYFSNLSVLGTDYQQSNFSLIGSSSLSFSNGGTSSPTLSNTISFSNSATYRYYELVFNSSNGANNGGMNVATGIHTSYGTGFALNAINMYGAALTPSTITFNQAATASGALTVSTGTLNATSISAGGAISISNSGAATLSGAIANNGANAASLVKSGAGTLTLSGTNTYTGGTTVSAGTLQLGAGGATGSIEGNVTNNATLAFNRSDDLTYANVISGTGSVTKMAANSLTLTGDNTYSGGTSISEGTVKAGSATALGTGAISVSDSAALDLNGQTMTSTGVLTLQGTGVSATGALLNSGSTAATYAGALALGANSSIMSGTSITSTISLTNTDALVGGGFTLTLGGVSTAGGDSFLYSVIDTTTTSVIKSGNAIAWNLYGANTYSGGTSVNGGTLRAGSSTALGSGAITVASGGSFDLRGQTMTSTGTLTLNGTGVSELGALRNSSPTAATATYAGPVVLAGITKIIAGSGPIQLTHTGTITGATFGLTLGGAQGGSIAAIIGTTTGSLTKQDSGTWILGGNNTYTGGTTINAGTLAISHANGLGTTAGGVTVANGATLDLRGAAVGAEAITLQGGTLATSTGTSSLSGGVTMTANSSVSVAGTQLTLSGVVSGTGFGLTKTGSGSLVLSGNNTYSGETAVSAGTLSISHASGLGGTGAGTSVDSGATLLFPVSVNVGAEAITLNGGTLRLQSGTTSLSGQVTLGANSSVSVDSGAQLTLSGVVSGTDRVLTKTSLGTLVLTGTNTYSGGTTINLGTLQLGAGGATGSIEGNVSNSGTLAFNRSDDVTYAGAISGTGAVTKMAANTLTLSGTNTYTGGTTINGGSLKDGVAERTDPFGSGTITINSGGTLVGERTTFSNSMVISGGTVRDNNGFGGTYSGAVSLLGDLSIAGANSIGFTGAISGPGGINNIGTVTTNLLGANTYSGSTTITAGTVRVGPTSAGTLGTGNVINNATLEFNRTDTHSVSNVISGSGSVTKLGTGTLILTGANSYTGATTVSDGTLAISHASGLGGTGAGTSVANGATLDLRGAAVGAEAITLNGGTLTASTGPSSLSGAVNLTSASVLSGAGALTLSGAITSNSNGLAILGTGAKTLSSTSNTLHTIATGTGVGALSVVNNAAMTIGQVTAGGSTYSGINSTDTVSVMTRTGELTVSQNVVTTSAATSYTTPALRLGAGSLTAAGTPTGGDVVLSGTPTVSVGTGGVALIYSGYATTSAALTLNASFAPKLTYYSINTDSTYVPTSFAAAYFTLFRESPATLYTLYLPNQRFTYGTPITSLNYCYSTSASNCSPVSVTGVPSTTQVVAASGAPDVGSYPLQIAPPAPDVRGYFFVAGNAVNIVVDPKPVTIANTAQTTTYDGLSTYSNLANAMTYTVSGLVGYDAVSSLTQTPSGNGLVASQVANAGSFTVTPGSVVLSTGKTSNYTFSYTAATATVNKADLKVTAKDDAKFIGEADVSGFAGVRYTGFVAGQTASVLSGSATVARSNASVGAAGTYAGVLSAADSTLSSNNYNLIYEAGSYTIVPADQLLIRLNDASTTYGTAPSYTVSSVQYKSSTGNAVVDLTSRAAINTAAFTLTDGAGGNTALNLGPQLASLSSAGQVAAGSYQVGASSITNTSANYSNTVNIVGSLAVEQKTLTPTATSGLSKSYDGTTSMSSLGFGLSGVVGADAVRATGLGTYADANAGNAKSFTVSGIGLGGTDATNYKLAANTLSATNGVVTTAPLLIKANNDSKTYDASAYAATAGVAYSGFVNGETVSDLGGTLAFGGTAIGAVNVGNYVITPSGQTSSNYAISFGDGALNISPADVRVSATNVALTGTVGKEYDGTNVATLTSSNYLITGWQGSDGANITQTTGTYDNANAGTNKLVSVTLASSDFSATNGTLLSNYNLPTAVSGNVGVISPKTVTVTNAARSNVYDGTSYAALALGTTYSVSAMVGPDAVASITQTPTGLSGSASGAAQAGTFTVTPGAAVLSTGTVSNYNFNYVDSTHTVTPAPLAVALTGTSSKVYDGTTAAALTASNFVVTGFVNSEGASVSKTSGTLDTANVGSTKALTTTLGSSDFAASSGTQLSNYTLPTSASGSIGAVTPAPLSAALTGTSSKVYDGSTAATLATGNFALTGFVNAEGASVSKTSGTLDTANVGTSKTVTAALSSSDFAASSGTQLSNYTLPTSASGSIGAVTPAPLSAALTGTSSKVYDGGTAATLAAGNFALTGFVNAEGASVSKTSGTLDTANVGTSKTVTAALSSSDFAASSGTQLSNYTLPTSASGSIGAVTPAPLTVSAASANKTYDGTAYTGGNGVAYSGFVNNETAGVLGGTLAYTGSSQGARNAGSYVIRPAGLTSSNYAVNFTDGSLSVAPAPLTVTAVTNTKSFDGNVQAQAVPVVSGLKGPDAVINLSEAYADANPGTGKTLSVQSGYQIVDGNNGKNYLVSLVPSQ
uniref:autotransporter-associated beta strand repeat-containing protein n=1 Tax=Limnohabitans sp. Rim8 TaxID=1100718 RepID=UPI0025FEA18F